MMLIDRPPRSRRCLGPVVLQPFARRAVPAGCLIAGCLAAALVTAPAASAASGRKSGAQALKPRIDLTAPAESNDIFSDITHTLNNYYDQYNAFKTQLQNDYNIQYSMQVSTFGQWGTPNSGPGVAELVYSPSITWTPFSNTSIGTGTINFAFQGNQFWTKANTNSQQAAMGLLAAPNDWGANGYQFSQLTYTQTFPGNVIAASIGQFSVGQFDGNQYAGNAQTNFVGYPLAQNATQTYANGGVGAYLQVTPNSLFAFAGGFQGATDINGESITGEGFASGKYAYFLNATWTPSLLGGGTYNIVWYDQPSVPEQPSNSQGISFSAVQMFNPAWGLFLRVNNASGQAIQIQTSIAGGAVWNNPFNRNRLDQLGLGLAWDLTNQTATTPGVRPSEYVLEAYYNFTVFKAMQVTPDIQLYASPAFAPTTSTAAVFTLRTTWSF